VRHYLGEHRKTYAIVSKRTELVAFSQHANTLRRLTGAVKFFSPMENLPSLPDDL
jgi:hypothetical protein